MSFINNFNQIDILIIVLTIISMIYGYSCELDKEILSYYPYFFQYIFQLTCILILVYLLKNILIWLYGTVGICFNVFIFIFLNKYFSNFIVSSITNTPIRILDKNFGILLVF